MSCASKLLFHFELAPISDLVESVKKALEAAVEDYVAEENQKWAATNKCPPGSCSDAQRLARANMPGVLVGCAADGAYASP